VRYGYGQLGRREFRVGQLYQIDPNGLVTLLKKINRLEKCDAESTHFLQTAAKVGDLEEMGLLGE